ncbi:MAG: hypothetical protein AAGB12_03255 [Pseudomonadota bacterium]
MFSALTTTIYRNLLLFILLTLLPACSVLAPNQHELRRSSQTVLAKIRAIDPTFDEFIKNAYAYVVFPQVDKSENQINGAFGDGAIFKEGEFEGLARLSQISVGFQLSGIRFIQVVVFQSPSAYETFLEGDFSVPFHVTARAIAPGAAAQSRYQDNLAVFTMTLGGLMFEANLRGQTLNRL